MNDQLHQLVDILNKDTYQKLDCVDINQKVTNLKKQENEIMIDSLDKLHKRKI